MKFVLALTREEAPAEGGRVTMHEELALALCCEVPPAATDASPMGMGMGGGGTWACSCSLGHVVQLGP